MSVKDYSHKTVKKAPAPAPPKPKPKPTTKASSTPPAPVAPPTNVAYIDPTKGNMSVVNVGGANPTDYQKAMQDEYIAKGYGAISDPTAVSNLQAMTYKAHGNPATDWAGHFNSVAGLVGAPSEAERQAAQARVDAYYAEKERSKPKWGVIPNGDGTNRMVDINSQEYRDWDANRLRDLFPQPAIEREIRDAGNQWSGGKEYDPLPTPPKPTPDLDILKPTPPVVPPVVTPPVEIPSEPVIPTAPVESTGGTGKFFEEEKMKAPANPPRTGVRTPIYMDTTRQRKVQYPSNASIFTGGGRGIFGAR